MSNQSIYKFMWEAKTSGCGWRERGGGRETYRKKDRQTERETAPGTI